MPRSIRFIDCTLSEGDDCVGHQLNWNKRLALLERLDEMGLGEITMPSHITFQEEHDLVRACRRLGLKTRLVAKGPGIAPPLKGRWREVIDRHVDLGCDVISPIIKWDFEHTLSNFTTGLSRDAIIDAIGEGVGYAKAKGVRVVPWIVDAMRTPVDSAGLFFKAIAEAGADGVYVVDSRGNSVPLATRHFIRRVRKAVGPDCDVYVQHTTISASPPRMRSRPSRAARTGSTARCSASPTGAAVSPSRRPRPCSRCTASRPESGSRSSMTSAASPRNL